LAYEELLDEMERGSRHLIIDGAAGSGKTWLINAFLARKKRRTIGCATTGLAGSHIDGTTVHAIFGFPLGLVVAGDQTRRRRDRELIIGADTLLIDEVSMLACSTLDAIDHDLRVLRRSTLPFGGMRLILVGDHYQICPVVKESDEAELRSLSPCYQEPFYYFQSEAFRSKPMLSQLKIFELRRCFRQSGDAKFKEILDRSRVGRLSDNDLRTLNTRVGLLPPTTTIPTIYMKRKHVEWANEVALRANPLHEWEVSPEPASVLTTTDLAIRSHPASDKIRLKIGARVMLTKNKSEDNYYNGTLGRVIDITADQSGRVTKVRVDTLSGNQVEVRRESFSVFRPHLDPRTGAIESATVAEIHSLPIRLAYGLTAHKAQGLTLEKVVVSRGVSVFAHGQMYTALSRVRNLEDLYLTHRIRPEDFSTSPVVAQFMDSMRPKIRQAL